MFRDHGNQEGELREIHRQLCSLNEKFNEQTYDLQRQIAEMQAHITHKFVENPEQSIDDSYAMPSRS
jgi:hypothetical protein